MRKKNTPAENGGERGLTLIETLLALALMAFLILGVTAVFVSSMRAGLASKHLTEGTVLAQEKMEELESISFDALPTGGDLDSSVSGFSDEVDKNLDGIEDYTRRWQIVDDTVSNGTKTMRVRVFANMRSLGPRKAVNLTHRRGE